MHLISMRYPSAMVRVKARETMSVWTMYVSWQVGYEIHRFLEIIQIMMNSSFNTGKYFLFKFKQKILMAFWDVTAVATLASSGASF